MLLLGAAISAGLLFILLRQFNPKDWSRFRAILGGLDVRILAIPLAAFACSSFLRPWRWQRIFPSGERPGFGPCFGALWAGNMANNAVPFRGGDVIRCFLVGGDTSLTKASVALATLGLEKILDGFALLGILLASFMFLSPPQWLGRLGFASAAAFGGALLAAIGLHYRTKWFLSLTRSSFKAFRLDSLGDRVATLFEWFARGLEAVSSPLIMAQLAAITALIWSADAVAVWGLALSLRIPLSIPGAAVVSAIVGLSLMIPSAPGFVGTYEFFSVAALRLLGVEFSAAMALTVFMHGWMAVCTTVAGTCGLWICGISFSRLVRGEPIAPPLPR
ncbi:MAG: lysylphosphatidylglycerol synthase transmembrane domain-containing protein [Candidatus Binataceae bacterium]